MTGTIPLHAPCHQVNGTPAGSGRDRVRTQVAHSGTQKGSHHGGGPGSCASRSLRGARQLLLCAGLCLPSPAQSPGCSNSHLTPHRDQRGTCPLGRHQGTCSSGSPPVCLDIMSGLWPSPGLARPGQVPTDPDTAPLPLSLRGPRSAPSRLPD